jgi:hypothetical protein
VAKFTGGDIFLLPFKEQLNELRRVVDGADEVVKPPNRPFFPPFLQLVAGSVEVEVSIMFSLHRVGSSTKDQLLHHSAEDVANAAKSAMLGVEVEFISKGCYSCVVVAGVVKDKVA